MSDTYKISLIQAGLLQMFHKIRTFLPKMPEYEWTLRAAKIIRYFLPDYNYVIWRLEKPNDKSRDNKFENAVFEDYIVFKDHCYGIVIFQKGQFKL